MKKITLIIIYFIKISNSLAGEKDLYDFLWLDPDKSVYVLQNKLYPKKDYYYLDLGYIKGLSSDFKDSTGVSISLGYYFKEEWAFELNHAQYNHISNSALENVKLVSGMLPFMRLMQQETIAYFIWSPFYGKINTFNKIIYFDWSFGFGTGISNALTNLKSITDPKVPNKFSQEYFNPIKLKTNVKFHLNKRTNLGIEFNSSNFQAGTAKVPSNKTWQQNNNIVVSLGVNF